MVPTPRQPLAINNTHNVDPSSPSNKSEQEAAQAIDTNDNQQPQIAASTISHNTDEENNNDDTSQNKKPIDESLDQRSQRSQNTEKDSEDEKNETLAEHETTPFIGPLGDYPQENFTHMCNVLAKMIKGETLTNNNQITPQDIEMFNQLSTGKRKLPMSIKNQWNKFRNSKQKIIIDMQYMNKDYKALKAAFVLNNPQNLLQFDKLVKIFPNIKEIICKKTDSTTGGDDRTSYAPEIITNEFIQGLYNMLPGISDDQARPNQLKKIIIQTKLSKININTNDHSLTFKLFSWEIQKESYPSEQDTNPKGEQLTLTYLPLSQKTENEDPPPPANSQPDQSQEERNCLLM